MRKPNRCVEDLTCHEVSKYGVVFSSMDAALPPTILQDFDENVDSHKKQDIVITGWTNNCNPAQRAVEELLAARPDLTEETHQALIDYIEDRDDMPYYLEKTFQVTLELMQQKEEQLARRRNPTRVGAVAVAAAV